MPAAYPPVGSRFRLAPEWVGTVSRVYGAEKTVDIRFTQAWVAKSKDGPVQFQIARVHTTPNGEFSYAGDEAPVYRANLPTVKEVAEFKTVSELRKVFGPQHGWTDGWGGPGRMSWTEQWIWFTLERENRLRYLEVCAQIEGAPKAKDAAIRILVLREGVFRPADPESAMERRKFKTGDELAAQEREKESAENEKYPAPLRSLVAARHAADDSGLVAYTKALNQFRDEPSAELLRQIVAQFSAGDVDFHSMFADLLAESARYVKVNKWKPLPRKAALCAGVDALSAAKTPSAFEDALTLLLDALGGGKLVFKVPSTDATVDVSANQTGSSESRSFGSSNITAVNLAQVTKATQEHLRKMHPELWSETK